MIHNLSLGNDPKLICGLAAMNYMLSSKSYYFGYKSYEKTTKFIGIAREDGMVVLMNVKDWKFHFSVSAHDFRINALKKIFYFIQPDEFNYFAINEYENLISCSDDGTVKFW